MSVDRWNTALVLGGIRSGKSEFAEALVADAASVRYVATSAAGEDDPEWMDRIETHQRRRPQTWSTEETGVDPGRLAMVLGEAKPDETLLIDDLGGWVATLLDPDNQPQDDVEMVDALAAAVRGCAGRVVLVSPEVGLSLVPATPVGRAFTDALGTTNQALAAVCDRVALVVAGQPTWIKAAPDPSLSRSPADPSTAAPSTAAPSTAAPSPFAPQPAAAAQAAAPPSVAVPVVTPLAQPAPIATPDVIVTAPDISGVSDEDVVFEPGMDLPMPDQDAGPDAHDRLVTLDLTGAGLGALSEAVEFAAATQGTTRPQPWSAVRVVLISGTHGGGAATGDDPADAQRRVTETEAGESALIRLAARAGADVAVIRTQPSGPMEDGPVMSAAEVDTALRQGWALAAAAERDGRDALVIASRGVGTDAAAAAVLAATTGAEPVAVLPRVLAPGGNYDDNAWMVRCAAVRDALHRIRQESRGALDILAQLGGADVAVAAGVLLGAAARRLPVLLDGPLGIAAGLVARDLGSQVRHWCLLPDAGTYPLVKQGADVLGLTPVTSLGLDLGEGLNALAALPVLRGAIDLAASLPVHPALLAGHETDGDGSGEGNRNTDTDTGTDRDRDRDNAAENDRNGGAENGSDNRAGDRDPEAENGSDHSTTSG